MTNEERAKAIRVKLAALNSELHAAQRVGLYVEIMVYKATVRIPHIQKRETKEL